MESGPDKPEQNRIDEGNVSVTPLQSSKNQREASISRVVEPRGFEPLIRQQRSSNVQH